MFFYFTVWFFFVKNMLNKSDKKIDWYETEKGHSYRVLVKFI